MPNAGSSDRVRSPGLWMAVAASLTLGLAPFVPLPHLVEKAIWLWRGQPLRAADLFDLAFHGAPWAWLAVEVVRSLRRR